MSFGLPQSLQLMMQSTIQRMTFYSTLTFTTTTAQSDGMGGVIDTEITSDPIPCRIAPIGTSADERAFAGVIGSRIGVLITIAPDQDIPASAQIHIDQEQARIEVLGILAPRTNMLEKRLVGVRL